MATLSKEAQTALDFFNAHRADTGYPPDAQVVAAGLGISHREACKRLDEAVTAGLLKKWSPEMKQLMTAFAASEDSDRAAHRRQLVTTIRDYSAAMRDSVA